MAVAQRRHRTDGVLPGPAMPNPMSFHGFANPSRESQTPDVICGVVRPHSRVCNQLRGGLPGESTTSPACTQATAAARRECIYLWQRRDVPESRKLHGWAQGIGRAFTASGHHPRPLHYGARRTPIVERCRHSQRRCGAEGRPRGKIPFVRACANSDRRAMGGEHWARPESDCSRPCALQCCCPVTTIRRCGPPVWTPALTST